jgi:phospholipid/cholesterol/gamma-HCH transport system substrate-binding protein
VSLSTKRQLESEIKVGLFVTIGIILTMLAILVLGSTENLLTRQARYISYFSSVEGLSIGAKVVLAGIGVGVIEDIDLDQEKRKIRVKYTVASKYADWIRADSSAEISTQGVLGDKYIAINTGTLDQPKVEPGSEVPGRAGKDLTQFLSKGDQLMINLTSISANLDKIIRNLEAGGRSEKIFDGLAQTSKNLSSVTDKLNRSLEEQQLKGAVKNLNSILGKINNGTGTLGALVNDPGLYDDAKALLGGANRNRIVRNLVRQTVRKGDEAAAEEQAAEASEPIGPAPQGAKRKK